LIQSKVAEEAPDTAAALGALGGLAGGDLDQTIAAGVDLLKDIRDDRREAKTAAESKTMGDGQVETKRPIVDPLRELLRGKKEEP